MYTIFCDAILEDGVKWQMFDVPITVLLLCTAIVDFVVPNLNSESNFLNYDHTLQYLLR